MDRSGMSAASDGQLKCGEPFCSGCMSNDRTFDIPKRCDDACDCIIWNAEQYNISLLRCVVRAIAEFCADCIGKRLRSAWMPACNGRDTTTRSMGAMSQCGAHGASSDQGNRLMSITHGERISGIGSFVDPRASSGLDVCFSCCLGGEMA
jgi:hypothetical protein